MWGKGGGGLGVVAVKGLPILILVIPTVSDVYNIKVKAITFCITTVVPVNCYRVSKQFRNNKTLTIYTGRSTNINSKKCISTQTTYYRPFTKLSILRLLYCKCI